MKRAIFLLFLILLCLSAGKGLHFLKDGFTPRRVDPLGFRVSFPTDEETTLALAQPFHFIGRGRQCFAFASADDRYVLKVPRTDAYKTPFWVRALPLYSLRHRVEQTRLKRLQSFLRSVELSLQDLKSQTGVIATHLGQSEPKRGPLILIDKLGCSRSLPLEKVSFILQYKKPLLTQALVTALKAGNRKEAEKILDAWVHLMAERGARGLLNKDPHFLYNYGFDGERAYQIDIGDFFRSPQLSPPEAYQKSIRDSIDPIQKWLRQRDPQMAEYLYTIVEMSLKRRFDQIGHVPEGPLQTLLPLAERGERNSNERGGPEASPR